MRNINLFIGLVLPFAGICQVDTVYMDGMGNPTAQAMAVSYSVIYADGNHWKKKVFRPSITDSCRNGNTGSGG